METEKSYFAYCLDTKTKLNYFIVPSEFLNPRPKAIYPEPGVAFVTLGEDFWGAVFQSAYHESLDVDPDDGSFLDQKSDKDFEHLLTEEEYKECLVLATASSVQELQKLIQVCQIKVPEIKRRLDDSVAGCQQHDEPEQQNKRIRNGESNQQKKSIDHSMVSQSSELKSVSARASLYFTPPEDAGKEMEKPIESHDVSENDERGDTHVRPDGVANLGFFESEIDGRVTKQNADNVCVLVIHYEFKNDPEYFRNGDACDVKRLKTFFGENRNCNFRNFRSPNKNRLLQLLSDEEKLLQFFNSKDDVPSVFVLFILSHGSENGEIATDHLDRKTNKYECFTTDEVFDSLQKLKRFDKCLKVMNFGPCRGSLVDCKFNLKDPYSNYDNRNSCRITIRSKMHNYVVYYSTVETTVANTDENGSWLVRNICTCLNEADGEPLLKFFTIVQNRMHETSRNFTTFDENTPLGQTPELKMFQQDRKFIISKAKTVSKPFSNTDGSGNVSKVSNEIHPNHFSWKSDERKNIRGRRGFILSVVQSKQVQEMKRVLQNLDFEITDWTLNGQSMEFYFKIVSTELEPDVGCIMTCMFGPVCENEQKEVCVRVGKTTCPITDILHSLVGPKNDKLIGKPKILIVVNVEAPQTDNISVDVKGLEVSATNHSGWLVLILKYEDALEKLIELLGKIDEKISLQELLEPLLTRESKREDVVLLNSTLQYLIKFPNWPRTFVKPEFKLKNTKISRDKTGSLKNSTQSAMEEKIDFDRLTEKAKHLFEENKKSIETGSSPKNLQMSSEIEPATGIVWLINSVAGAGKSTVLKEMKHQLTKYYGGFKILLIPLKKYYRYLFDMPALNVNEIEFLAKTTCNSHDDIKKWIKKREVVVFLDGFDEVCPDFREKIIKIVIALNQASVPLFVGTRPHELHHIQDRIKNSTMVEIEPLDKKMQIEFLKIVAGKNQQEIEQLMKIFKDQNILGNPLYLKLLAENKSNGNLYEIFDTIVRRKVEICLVTENENKDVGKHMIDKELKVIQLVASRYVTGAKIDQGIVTKEDLEEMNAFGVVTYCNERVNFTHQTFAEFLTAQKFIIDLKNPGPEKVPLFNDELVQCRKFVDLFFSTEKGKDETYAEAFRDWAKSTEPLKLVRQICHENSKQMFKLLNPDLSLKDEDGKNALHFALRHLEMVKMVHERNSRLATETTKNGENCLHLAIDDIECSEDVAIWLLQNTEVDKNAETMVKDSPLLLACERKKWQLAKEFISTDVEVNKISRGGESILHYVIKSNDKDLVRALLRRGANVNSKCQKGKTALHIAASINNLEMVEILLDNGAKVNAQDNEKCTALHCLATKLNPAAGMVRKLLERSADLHLKTLNGASALHLAAMWNEKPDIVKILLEKGANVHFKDKDGLTALQIAARWNKNPEIVKILLGKGARVNEQDNDKWTALHYAARYSEGPEVVHQLLENGLDINLKTNHGETALYFAVKYKPVRGIVLNLLDHGAKVNKMIRNDKECAAAFRSMHINTLKYKLKNLFLK